MEEHSSGEALAAPFIGFTVGTALFGITLTQAYRYFLRYSRDPLWCKIKVTAVCVLDFLHFVFTVDLMYTSLILNFGVAEASSRNMWSLKAMGTTQAVLIIFVQIIYLKRIRTFSSIPAINSPAFSQFMQATVWFVGLVAIGSGIAVCYELQKLEVILSLAGNSEWIVYMGFGATTAIDIVIAVMMCLVIYKTRSDIGANYISRRSDRLFRSLITYSLATGIVTSSVSLLVIVLYVARPNSLLYIAVTFSAPRLYTNSVFVMLDHIRRHVNGDVVDDPQGFEPPGGIAFRGLSTAPSRRTRDTGCNAINIDTPLANRTRRNQRIIVMNDTRSLTDSDSSEGDVGKQEKGVIHEQGDVDLFSPYYSPLEARKKMGTIFRVHEPEATGGSRSWIDFWKAQARLWANWPVDRRSSL